MDNIINFVSAVDKYLNILESPRPGQGNFDAEKVWLMNSKISMWDFYGVPQEVYSTFSVEEKSKMLREYYSKLLQKYYGPGKKLLFLSGWLGLCTGYFGLFSGKNSLAYSLVIAFVLFVASQHALSTETDSSISQTIMDSNKIFMMKNIFSDNRAETAITAEKTSFKRNTINIWPDCGFFRQQPCDFSDEKENFPENSIYYIK